MRRAALLVWLLGVAAAAGEVTGNVTLNTVPPGLYVYELKSDRAQPLHIGYSNRMLTQLPRTDNFMVTFSYPPDPPDASFRLRVVMSEATRMPLYPAEPVEVELSPKALANYRWDHFVKPYQLPAALVSLVVLACAVGVYVRVLVPRRERQRLQALRRSRWQALRPTLDRSDPQIGKRVGAYRLVSRLGAGGMAAVYRALPEATLDDEEAVAVKVLHPAGSAEAEQRFRQEAAVCARLHHPNLVRILDAGDQDGQLYLAMEIVRGRTLRSELQAGGVPLKRVQALFRQVFAGVMAAHEQGVVHRDLKPDNVMLTDDGRLVVMDFGLARRQDAASLTALGAVMGTPAYMAPEQIRGEEVDARTDQYALGVMLYELLAGRLPFDGNLDSMQMLMKHLSEEPAPLEGVEPALAAAVLRMLAKAPKDRFPTLQAAAAELF